jgi:hypothetical protein
VTGAPAFAVAAEAVRRLLAGRVFTGDMDTSSQPTS